MTRAVPRVAPRVARRLAPRVALTFLGILFVFVVLGCALALPTAGSAGSPTDAPAAGSPVVPSGPAALAPIGPVEEAQVVRVVDGDTLIIDRGRGSERLRYIGIDTPESVIADQSPEPFGAEATAANRELVVGGVVHLERDVSETDRFGRLLRYVWVCDDGDPAQWTLVNLALVAAGWAAVTTFPPDVRYVDLFVAAQRGARDAGLGLWSQGVVPAP